jgi:hypothetical protein
MTALTDGHIFVGDISNVAQDVAMSGVVAIDDTGATTTKGTFGITIDGGGAVPGTGSQGFVTIPYSCTITNWYMAANASGSAVIDIKRSAASIVGGGNKPTLSSQSSANAVVSSWTSASISAGDIIEFNLDSASTLTRVNLVLKVTRSS